MSTTSQPAFYDDSAQGWEGPWRMVHPVLHPQLPLRPAETGKIPHDYPGEVLKVYEV